MGRDECGREAPADFGTQWFHAMPLRGVAALLLLGGVLYAVPSGKSSYIQDYLLLGETGHCYIPPLSLSVVAIVLSIVGLLIREHQAASSSLRPVVRFSLVTSGMAPRNTLATTEVPKSAVGGSSMWKTSRNVRRTPMSCRESAITRSM